MNWLFTLAALAVLQTPDATQAKPHLKPKWVAQPTAEQLIKAFPDKALYASKGGKVVMHCAVAADGTLKTCKITEETPTGYGFGAAVLSLAPLYRAAPTMADGSATSDGEVDIPVEFRL